MSIQGIDQSGTPLLPDPLKPTDRPDERAASAGAADSAPTPQDRVEISATARQLAQSSEAGEASTVESAGAEQPGLDPERMRTILGRLGERYYDRRGVQIEIAQRVLPDLGSPPTT